MLSHPPSASLASGAQPDGHLQEEGVWGGQGSALGTDSIPNTGTGCCLQPHPHPHHGDSHGSHRTKAHTEVHTEARLLIYTPTTRSDTQKQLGMVPHACNASDSGA